MKTATNIDILLDFLNTPLDSGDAIFEQFSTLPRAIVGKSTEPLQRYVYIPGTRTNKVVLVAHIDTIWDKSYEKRFSGERSVVFENGIFKSSNPDCGIGADCRAGCAMLWTLRDFGHSILIVDGEEHGKHGAKYLRKSNPKLFREINHHQFIIEFDSHGTNSCLFNQVDNTKAFKRYIENDLGFKDSRHSGGTDLQILCKSICGANLGIGYHRCHTKDEVLILSEWENTLTKSLAFLDKPLPKFRALLLPRYVRFVKKCACKILKILKLR